jgi:glutamine amidotransferase
MIGIVDYGLGNLTSVAGAVEWLGYEPLVTAERDELEKADKLILPGVGAFGDGMKKLRERGLEDALNEIVCGGGKPILGICLGCQLMTQGSNEFGECKGLSWFESMTERLQPENPELRVPHVGWNDLEQTGSSILFEDVPKNAVFYYVHSYCVNVTDSEVVGTCSYGEPFAAVLEKGNIYATQFHPEKSQKDGLQLLRNFLAKA